MKTKTKIIFVKLNNLPPNYLSCQGVSRCDTVYYAAFTLAQHVARQQVARTSNLLRATSNMLSVTSCLLPATFCLMRARNMLLNMLL